MKKEDLENGMFVITRNKDLGLVIREFTHVCTDIGENYGLPTRSDVIIFRNGGWAKISDYNENLLMKPNLEYSIDEIFIRNINNAGPPDWDETKDRHILY